MKNLSLSVFAFHLYNTLDDAPNTTSQQANQLWESFRQVGQLLGCSNLNNLTSYLNLTNPDPLNKWLNPDRQPLQLKITDQTDYPISGELSAFLLHDTYCADLSLYPQDPQQEIDIEQLHVFQPIKLIDTIQADLGKIIWLTGESTDLNQLDQTKATAWASALAGQSLPQFLGKDILLNSPLFVFQTDNLTILISLAQPGIVNETRVGKDYYWVRELLWSYSKIIYVYQQAKDCYQLARQSYNRLENKLKSFYHILRIDNLDRVQELEKLLGEIPEILLEYTCYLRDLKAHHTTIQANIDNLNKCIKYLKKSGDTLDTWSNFAEKTCTHDFKQVQTYIDYLQSGIELFNQLMNVIRATTELEKAKSNELLEKSNENLQDTIQAVGVGLGVAAIIASTSSIITILVSAGVGACSWYLVKTYIKAKHENKKLSEVIKQIFNQSQITKLLKGQ